MSNLSEDAGAAAAPHGLTLDGVRYEFRHLGVAELAGYQRRRFERERDELRLLREDYPEAEYTRRLDELRDRFRRGEFDFLADVERLGLRQDGPPDPASMTPAQRHEMPALILRVLGMMTGRPDAENWQLFIRLPEEAGLMMKQVIEESFPKTQAGPAGATGPAARS